MLTSLLANKLFTLFTVITLGLALGRLHLAGLSLGSSGVIFVALAFGHWGHQLPANIGELGLVLFVYCVGLSAGPGFFRTFVHQGKTLALLSATLIAVGGATTWFLASVLSIPRDLTVGLFAGALTSTPALAVALEALPAGVQTAVGYGIAYPFGVVGLVLFVQLLPRLLRQDLDALARRLGSQQDTSGTIVHVLVEVMNPAVVGKQLDELEFLPAANVQVSRVLHGNRLVPLSANFTLAAGQHILVVGQASRLPAVINLFGKRSERTDYTLDTERERRQIIVSSKNVVGRSLAELKLRNVFGVTVSRIMRHGLEFVPTASDEIEYGDALSVVGEPDQLDRFAAFAGHRARSFDETDLISLGVGLLVGMLVGLVSIELSGYRFSLGLAGGPLLVALVLGHFGRIGPVVGHLPRASHMLLLQTGSVFFLASAGVDAGGSLMSVIREYGVTLCGGALIVTFLPLALGYCIGRFGLKLNLLQIVGGVCGGMTSTPGLSAVTAQTDSDIPVVSYATAYPVALILMTVGTQVLASALS